MRKIFKTISSVFKRDKRDLLSLKGELRAIALQFYADNKKEGKR